ncbi:MAG: 2Fe-2S iron-sulfur cluster binding domain-containing protein [Firmicutes bacterium]|nr:2Fe-2S iron-sulfur cluster binding domain-containing protein [Bacillota bacterium]
MERIKLTIDNKPVEVEAGTTILEAAQKIGVHIPTLCYHPELRLEGACRICVVEVEGLRNLVASCVYPVADNMVVKTNSESVRRARKTVLELLIANHPMDCLVCSRHGECELQDLSRQLGIRQVRFTGGKRDMAVDESSHSIVRDPNKCVLCGRCVRVCAETQAVSAIGVANRGSSSIVTTPFNKGLADGPCVGCGQCINVCPVAALREKDDTERVWGALHDPQAHVVVQVAPAVRAALGEEFGMRPGSLVTGKTVTALRQLGFDQIFDTQFAADLTIIEEGHEFIHRLKNNVNLPLITSCSPGWVGYCERFYPEMLPHVSTCKSPQQMFGVLAKTYYAERANINPANIFSVSVMPCTAKKSEAAREEMQSSGYRDVDAVITTRELASMIREAGIDFANLPDSEFELPMGMSTGAGTIFGVTGGVMEAALRTVAEILDGEELPSLEFQQVRGFAGVREATIRIAGQPVRIAIANGLAHAKRLLDSIKAGEAEYHFIEIMGCPGGCIGGGGQPLSTDPEIRMHRAAALYRQDMLKKVRKSHENPAVKELYRSFLGEPNGEKAHQLLHTHYQARSRY